MKLPEILSAAWFPSTTRSSQQLGAIHGTRSLRFRSRIAITSNRDLVSIGIRTRTPLSYDGSLVAISSSFAEATLERTTTDSSISTGTSPVHFRLSLPLLQPPRNSRE